MTNNTSEEETVREMIYSRDTRNTVWNGTAASRCEEEKLDF